MNKQRGVIATGWLILAGVIAAGLVLTGLVKVWNNYTNGIDQAGYDRGVAQTNASYTERDNKQLQTALVRVKTLEDAARAKEAAYAADMEGVRSQLEKEKTNAKAAEKRVLADIAAGKLRVRASAFQAGACPAVGGGSEARAVEPGAGGSDGPPRCQLSATARSDILGIGREANEVVAQLAAAQAVIASDRVLCNAP